ALLQAEPGLVAAVGGEEDPAAVPGPAGRSIVERSARQGTRRAARGGKDPEVIGMLVVVEADVVLAEDRLGDDARGLALRLLAVGRIERGMMRAQKRDPSAVRRPRGLGGA